jgi:solute carrier family 35, member F1/2
VLICIAGLGMLVASDHLTDKDYPALSMAKGDIFMIVGASLYGFSTSASSPPPSTSVERMSWID